MSVHIYMYSIYTVHIHYILIHRV